MRSALALYGFDRGFVVFRTSLCGWPEIFSISFLKTKSTSCSTCICAFALIPFMEYDVVFPSIFLNSFKLVFREGGSSFAIHRFAFSQDCSFRSKVCSSNSVSLSACV